ncbi:hypothetical protein N7489_000739 [Penicillium chrysogenum]|uniref:uncharacterized protein n=1 Tax=Penicillium chrysogenum TaxID=5076 RepID=UPI0024DF2FAF|nr:uncharacterized protein N7489_000739 [Penicillium chrysogenum]KAJ5250329.1 hypothetical protein N7489_000739 [Penicillium chrysogenum]
MSTSKRTLEGLEHPKEKRVCRPAPLKLKCSSDMPAHLANGDNLSPFVTGQPSPIPGKMFSNVLDINESSKTASTELVNGDNLSPRLVQELGQPSPIPHAQLNKSLNINEPSEATSTQGPFLFSGTQEKAQPIAKFNPRLSTPKNEASTRVNVNWPLPYTRTVGPVNEDGFAVVTQTWYDYSSMTDSDSQSSGSPLSFHFDPRSLPLLEHALESSTSAGPMEQLARSRALLRDFAVVALSVTTGFQVIATILSLVDWPNSQLNETTLT